MPKFTFATLPATVKDVRPFTVPSLPAAVPTVSPVFTQPGGKVVVGKGLPTTPGALFSAMV
jgi:hypothetical protein